MAEYLTYREAARRVRRSVRTIKRWRRAGLPMSFDEQGRRVVDERTLLDLEGNFGLGRLWSKEDEALAAVQGVQVRTDGLAKTLDELVAKIVA